MAHYCVFCERSYITFTKLRNHICKSSHRDSVQSTDFDSEEEKENWIKTSFELENSETSLEVLSPTMEEENYAGIKSEFEYTVELNDNVGSDIENNISPALRKMLEGKTKHDDVNEVTENVGDDSNGVKSESDESSDYVYVLEPDNSINFNHDNQNESKSKEAVKDSVHDIQSKSEPTGVIDLSGSNKRKRKSNLNTALSHILKTKSVNQQNEAAFKESHSDEVHANKVQIIEKTETEVSQNALSDISADTVKDLSIKNEHNAAVETPTVSTPTFSTPNTGSARKNRRKRSVPVRCEKNEEIGDINEIMKEYGVQPNIKVDPGKQELAENSHDIAPLDLTPKSVGNTGTTSGTNISLEPVDLTASAKNKTIENVIKTEPKTPENTEPVDLSKPVQNSMPNVMKNGSTNGGLLPPMLPNAAQFDPVQMRQLFETVYKMQAQFPNQNLLQAQLMQFHALMQNAMLNGGMMPLNNSNGMKSGKHVKSDKNDNIIKTEPGLTNDMMTNDFQKFNLELMHKNGLIQNNFAPPFSGVIPGSPFTMNQTNQFRNRSAKKKGKDLFLMDESNLDSIKLESSTPQGLVVLDGKQSPEQILETLSQHFPIVPIESLPKAQIGDDINSARFYVKDNEQIRVIVDSLLQVGVLDFDEQQIHGTEPVYKYICRVCSQTFFHVEHLTKHIKKCHIVKKYQCSECDRSFHDAGNYRQHMRVHDETDIPYECPECKRRFRHKCTLKVHMRIHTGEKPFRCDICDATFKISSGLQTHMRKHTGETPYACEFCDLRFKCQSNLKQHLFQHTQVRPFPCEICGKTYSRKSIRDAHLLTHAKDSVKNEHVKKWIESMPSQALAVGGND